MAKGTITSPWTVEDEDEDLKPLDLNPPPSLKHSFSGTLDHFLYPSPTKAEKKTTPLPSPGATRKRPSIALADTNEEPEADPMVTIPFSDQGPKPKKTKRLKIDKSKIDVSKLPGLPDSIAPNLIAWTVGENPGIQSALNGHCYSNPNRFWPFLHKSGMTPRRCAPEEDQDCPRLFGLGHTNVCPRTTRSASELTMTEKRAGWVVLEEKIRKYRPEVIVFCGKGIFESNFIVRHGRKYKGEFNYEWQDERIGAIEGEWEGARLFVAPSTSGLAGFPPMEVKVRHWKVLGDYVRKRQGELGYLPPVVKSE